MTTVANNDTGTESKMPFLAAAAVAPTTMTTTNFEVNVTKDTFKFNAAHFVAYRGFRERLHGHNYRVAVRLLGNRRIGPDGYVIDFGCVKKVTRAVCREINEHFLCPMRSDVIYISVVGESDGGDGGKDEDEDKGKGKDKDKDKDEKVEKEKHVTGRGVSGGSIRLECEDGAVFVFPRGDCYMLPIVHATTEELAIYLWGKILEGLDSEYLAKRGVHTMEVTVAEAMGQEAVFRMSIPDVDATPDEKRRLYDVSTYIQRGEVVPMPCPLAPPSVAAADADALPSSVLGKKRRTEDGTTTAACENGSCVGCGCGSGHLSMSAKLQALADAINSGHFSNGGKSAKKKEVQIADLEIFLNGK